MHLRRATANCIFSRPEKVAALRTLWRASKSSVMLCCCTYCRAVGTRVTTTKECPPAAFIVYCALTIASRMHSERERHSICIPGAAFCQRALLFGRDKTPGLLCSVSCILLAAGSRIFALQFNYVSTCSRAHTHETLKEPRSPSLSSLSLAAFNYKRHSVWCKTAAGLKKSSQHLLSTPY